MRSGQEATDRDTHTKTGMSKSMQLTEWINKQKKGGWPKTKQNTGKANNKIKKKQSGKQS